MKYLNDKSTPCYRCITEEEIPGDDKNRLGMMEIEAEEMLYTGDMKEKLWIKCFSEEQHKHSIEEKAEARMKRIDKLSKAFDEA